jgi:hypothetical protein
MNSTSLYQSKVSGGLAFALLLVAYTFTLSPTMLHIDCGELAAAQYTLGVSHPTGYPLFTLLGYLFLKIPLFDRPITQSNWLSALWTAAGTGIFTHLLFRFLTFNFPVSSSKKKEEKPRPVCSEAEAFWISLASGLFFGFTLTVWAQATSVEVYSLHILMLALMLTFLFSAWEKNSKQSWIWASVVMALGFSNHMTTLMILPTAGFLYFHKNGLNKAAFQALILPALAGLGVLAALYGFLFYRAGTQPILNWGNIHDWTTFERHISGHQYRTWIMAGSKVAAKNLGKFLKALPSEWAMVGPVLVILGFSYAFRMAKTLAWALLIGLIFNILYVIQYDIKDLEPYFLLAMMSMSFFMAYGMKKILDQLKKASLAPVMILFPVLAFGLNLSKSDQSKTRFFEQYTQSSLDSVEPNALVLSQQWDFLITPYYYLRMAEGKYPNLMVLDKELLRRSWYINGQVRLLDKDLFQGAENEVEIFLKSLKPFEEGKPYESAIIEEAYQNLIGKILTEQWKKRPVYVGMEYYRTQEMRVPAGFSLIPVGFFLKLMPTDQAKIYFPTPLKTFSPEIPENWGPKSGNAYYSDFIKKMWDLGCSTRAEYENFHQKPDLANAWRNAAQLP